MDEGDTCRICRTGEEDGTPLYHPCKCSGSIAKVHQDCLIEWLQHSKKKSCELCNTELRFHKVYSPSMPIKLPAHLYIRRLILKVFIAFRFVLRGIFVGSAWLALLPLGNLYIWRLHFWIVDALLWGIIGGDPPSSRSYMNGNGTDIQSNHTSNLVETLATVTNSTITSVSGSTKVDAYQTEISGIPFPLLPLEKLIMRIINHAGYRRFFDTLAHDTFEGQILTCAVVVLFVALFLLREWCLQNMPQQVEGLAFQPQQAPPPALIAAAAMDAENAILPRNPGQPPAPPGLARPQQINRRPANAIRNPFEPRDLPPREQRNDIDQIDEDNEADRDSDVSDNNIVFREGEDEASDDDDASSDNQEPAQGAAVLAENEVAEEAAGVPNLANDDGDNNINNEAAVINEDEAEEPQLNPINAIVGEGEPPRIPIGLPQRNEEIAAPEFDANDWDEGDGENGERLEDDLDGMMEAIGMRGPLINLITNMTMMFVLCSFILTVFVALPYSMGRLLGLGHNLVKLVTLPIRLLRIGTDPIVDRLVDLVRRFFLYFWNSNGKQASTSTLLNVQSTARSSFWKNVSTTFHQNTVIASPREALRTTILSLINNLGRIIRQSFESLEVLLNKLDAMTHGRRSIDRAFCIGLGHFYWLVGLAIQHRMSHLYIRWNFKTLKAFVDQQIVVLKVLGFIILELMVFPLCCGVLTDISLHPLWKDVSISSRIALVQNKPLSICFTLWSLGTLYMFALAQFVSHTRSIVRPGVLCFVRDAGDPNFHPIKDILERRSLEQLRKIGISGIIYSSILAVTLGLCTRMLALVTIGIVPLNWNVHQTFSSIGFEMIGVAVLLPVAIKAWFPTNWIRRAAKKWWRSTARALCISSYLIGGRYPEEEKPVDHIKSITAWFIDQLRLIGIVPEVQEADKNKVESKEENSENGIQWGGFGRVPADDHAIMTSPLVIRTDSSGQPIDARGKEAMKAQVEAIEKVTTKKPLYTIVHLPNNFRARIITLIVALWFTLCTVLLTILLPPLIVGRSTILIIKWNLGTKSELSESTQVHDGLAWALGCCIFGISHTVGSKVQRMYLKMRTSSNAPRRFGKHVRRFGQRCCLILFLGFITSTGLGMVVEVYLNGLTRVFAGTPTMPDLSFFHVWSMGLMEQHLIYEIIRIRRGRAFRPNWDDKEMGTIAGGALGPMYALLELQNGGWRKPKLMAMIRGPFSFVFLLHLCSLGVPLILCKLVHNYSNKNNSNRSTEIMEKINAAQTSLIFAICSFIIIFALFYQKIVERMNSWTDILKDEHFLISTELKNYSQDQQSTNQQGSLNGQTNTEEDQRQNQDARLNAEGPIPDALLRAGN